MTTETEVHPEPRPEETKRGGGARKVIFSLVGIVLLAGAGWFGYHWWTEGRFMVSTDDAYIEGDIAVIAPKVSGYVKTVEVQNNQQVKQGDLLVKIDDGDYQNAVAQAEAQLNAQNVALKATEAQIAGAKASLSQAKANRDALNPQIDNAKTVLQRADTLREKGAATVASFDDARSALDQLKAKVQAADAAVEVAKSNISIAQAQLAQQQAALQERKLAVDMAKRNLGFTEIRAPFDGVFGNKNVQVGDFVSTGIRLGALVPTDDLYIVANFKETDLDRLGVDAKVKVSVDAFEKDDFTGTIESFSPASGAVFALLPPQNATGNFTKIVQRLPVRISIPKDVLDRQYLKAGLSVTVDVDTRTAPDGTLGETLAANR
ncbi:HlyD family secretion protein [Martelella mediterranea]|uniref:Multidrug resistance protein MdtN n=1 Tax=Martelella mediterranea DSM 17316 TaxID=1122214 RepID=A0A1U9Z796_9HYPH|nr:HlyD family secretion protein [Martelella mediterranea]AQZ53575.1 Multidrug resistance protein MdtN [Martelella mediterranea DSM 17316]